MPGSKSVLNKMRGKGHLLLAIPIYVLSVKYLSGNDEVLLSPFFALFCITAMLGALFPDIDWAIDRLIPGFGHRNPLTHSLLTPLLLYTMMYYYRVSQTILINIYDAFTISIATHLLGDVIKTGSLVWIKSRRIEKAWYMLNGAFLIVLLNLTGFLSFFDI